MGLGNGILTLGAFGQGILQGRVLGLAGASSEQMLEIMNASGSAVALTGVSLALQALETCAAPIFALLLVEEGLNAANWKQDIIWILGLAVVTEIPYNLAVSGTALVPGSLNPVFTVALCRVLLLFYQHFSGKSWGNRLVKAAVTIAAILWAQLLSISYGTPMVVLTWVMWLMSRRLNFRGFVGAAAAALCAFFSPFFLASPMGCLPVHLYNGQPSTAPKAVRYLIYPAILLIMFLAGMLI